MSNATTGTPIHNDATRTAIERAQFTVSDFCERGGAEYDRKVAVALQLGLCAFGRGGLTAVEEELADLQRGDAAEAVVWNLRNFHHQLTLAA